MILVFLVLEVRVLIPMEPNFLSIDIMHLSQLEMLSSFLLVQVMIYHQLIMMVDLVYQLSK